jgi:DNA-directed RNA polymerase subunit M/transcription elongation factor TFIIS
MPAEFRTIEKFCEECGSLLVLNNTRDITRKRFCNRKCNAFHSIKKVSSNPIAKAKIVAALNTPEANQKKRLSGKLNGRWKSDRSLIKAKRMYFEEKQFVNEVMRERNFTCEVTGERGGKLSLHHKNGVGSFPNLRFERSNVVVIKKSIHQSFHNMYGTVNITEDLWENFIRNKEYACQH